MGPAHGNGGAANHDGQRITPGKDAAMGHLHLRTLIDAKRPQALRFVRSEHIPVYRSDLRALAKRQNVECQSHDPNVRLPDATPNCNLFSIGD